MGLAARGGGGPQLRFEILTASALDRDAWDGCFTRTLTACLREGIDDEPTTLFGASRSPRSSGTPARSSATAPTNGADPGLFSPVTWPKPRPAWAGTWAGMRLSD